MNEDALAILAEHQYVPSLARGVSRCSCGIQFHGMPHKHRAHVAQVLAEWVAGEKARAFNEGVIAQREATRAARGTVGRIVYANPYRKDQEADHGHDA